MVERISEAELAELERLGAVLERLEAELSSSDATTIYSTLSKLDMAREKHEFAACNLAPALAAEVRRLRDIIQRAQVALDDDDADRSVAAVWNILDPHNAAEADHD